MKNNMKNIVKQVMKRLIMAILIMIALWTIMLFTFRPVTGLHRVWLKHSVLGTRLSTEWCEASNENYLAKTKEYLMENFIPEKFNHAPDKITLWYTIKSSDLGDIDVFFKENEKWYYFTIQDCYAADEELYSLMREETDSKEEGLDTVSK